MVVWKHIMPYRWVLEAAEPTPGVVHQFGIIKEKLDKFRNKLIFSQPHHSISDGAGGFGGSFPTASAYGAHGAGGSGDPGEASVQLLSGSGGIAKYLQTVVDEKREREHQQQHINAYSHLYEQQDPLQHQQHVMAAAGSEAQRKQLSGLLSVQIANVVGGQQQRQQQPQHQGLQSVGDAALTFQPRVPSPPLHAIQSGGFAPRGDSFGDLQAAMPAGASQAQRGWLTSPSDCIDTLYSQVSAALSQGIQGGIATGTGANGAGNPPNPAEFSPLYYS